MSRALASRTQRRAQDDVRSVENNRKRYDGYLAALLDPEIWTLDRATRTKIARRDERQTRIGRGRSPPTIESRKRRKQTAKVLPVYNYFERFAADGGQRPTVRRAASTARSSNTPAASSAPATRCPKPNGERFPEFRDSNKESLELDLFSSEPVHDDAEIVKLTDSLTDMATRFGTRRSARQAGAGRQIADRPRHRAGDAERS